MTPRFRPGEGQRSPQPKSPHGLPLRRGTTTALILRGPFGELVSVGLDDVQPAVPAGIHPGIGLCAHMGRARGAATPCRQGAARRLACRGRTARFPRCSRAAGRRRGHHAPGLHRCGYRPRRAPCGHPRSRLHRIVSDRKSGSVTRPSLPQGLGVFFTSSCRSSFCRLT